MGATACRGWFRIFIFRCSEVGLDLPLLCFQKLDLSFAIIGVQGLDYTFCIVAAAAVSVVI